MNTLKTIGDEPVVRLQANSRRAGEPSLTGAGALIARVRARWDGTIREASRYSSVPAQFLGALVANESAGDPRAVRFEPAVYRHLTRVAEGKSPRYGSLRRAEVAAEIDDILHPKTPAFHADFLTPSFGKAYGERLAQTPDEALRELATSWGLTQIMGYHMVGRAGTPRDLVEPRFHFRVALELLAEFAERYQLNLARDFAELFRCWNTGQPCGATADPAYVENGLQRMELYLCVIG
jgi:hypothetical protein